MWFPFKKANAYTPQTQQQSAYIGLKARLSRVWAHLFVILIVIKIIWLFETANTIRSASKAADEHIVAPMCQTISDTVTVALNAPINFANSQILQKEAEIKQSIDTLAADIDVLADTLAILFKMVVGYYYGTYICLVRVLVDSSLGALSSGIAEAEDQANVVVNSLISKVKSSAGALSSGLEATTSSLAGLINTFNTSPSAPQKQNLLGSGPIGSLISDLNQFSDSNFNITLSTNISTKISALQSNLPSVDDLWAKLLNRSVTPIKAIAPQLMQIKSKIDLSGLQLNAFDTPQICYSSENSALSTTPANQTWIAPIGSSIASVFTSFAIALIILLLFLILLLIALEFVNYRSQYRAIKSFKAQVYHYVDTRNPLPYYNHNNSPNPLPTNYHNNSPNSKLLSNSAQIQKKSSRITSVLSSQHSNNPQSPQNQHSRSAQYTRRSQTTKPIPKLILLPKNFDLTESIIKTPDYRYSYASGSDDYYTSDDCLRPFPNKNTTELSTKPRDARHTKSFDKPSNFSPECFDQELLDLYYLPSNSVLKYAKRTTKALVDLAVSNNNQPQKYPQPDYQFNPQPPNTAQIILQNNTSNSNNTTSLKYRYPANHNKISILLRWFVHYVYSPPLITLFLSGICVLIYLPIQISLINKATSHYTPLLAQKFSPAQQSNNTTLLQSLPNSTIPYLQSNYSDFANRQITLLENQINQSILSLSLIKTTNSSSNVLTSINSLNNTLSDIVDTYTTTLTRSLNNTIFLTPVLGYLNCTIGKQIANTQLLISLIISKSNLLVLSTPSFKIKRFSPTAFSLPNIQLANINPTNYTISASKSKLGTLLTGQFLPPASLHSNQDSSRFGGYSGGLVKNLANLALSHLRSEKNAAFALILPWIVLLTFGTIRILFCFFNHAS
ncbi:hypothetical protein BB561_005568 [Smittium simulii]|uniref:Plasma membrane fusion protein PRM1 n=1 Tax=Smittium simulii TaxID=133385 RepID=A0A2T9Y9T4_9FUNG|nr:hypothetical protein BB561_005568 [Smittium simulii]